MKHMKSENDSYIQSSQMGYLLIYITYITSVDKHAEILRTVGSVPFNAGADDVIDDEYPICISNDKSNSLTNMICTLFLRKQLNRTQSYSFDFNLEFEFHRNTCTHSHFLHQYNNNNNRHC